MINYKAIAWQRENHFSPAKDLFSNQVIFESLNVTFSCFHSSKQVSVNHPNAARNNVGVCSYLMGNIAIRIEEIACQNLRGWQDRIQEEMKQGRKGRRREKVTQTMK